MADDWSRQEVEATVGDYFSMLHAELRGKPYNKTEHRRHLGSLLRARSDGAIVTAAWLVPNQPIVDVVEVQVQQPAVVPAIDDILASLVDAPAVDPADRTYPRSAVRERPVLRRGI